MDRQLEERRIVRRTEVSILTGLARATIYQNWSRHCATSGLGGVEQTKSIYLPVCL